MLSPFKSWRFGLGYLAFVVAGSLLLLAWLAYREEQESVRLFKALAKSQAEFVRQMRLPRSARLALDLERLSGVTVYFRTGELVDGVKFHLLSEAPAGDALIDLPKGRQALIVRLDDKDDMIFVRHPQGSNLSMDDPATRNAFLAFWAMSAVVGWLLARERSRRARSERLAMLGRVATSLAHDIKNPLASIQLHAQLMSPSNVEDAQAVKLIADESEVIAGLVNQWLHLANPQPPKLVRLDAAACLAGVLTRLDAQARHVGVDIENRVTGPIWVPGDESRLAQAFRNLLVNALQAMPRGGKVRVEAETTAAEAVMRFTDSGAGFSEAALNRGTELFFTEKEGGMGVGLNIVAAIVEAHGGRLALQNDPKGGAVVTVSLPLHAP